MKAATELDVSIDQFVYRGLPPLAAWPAFHGLPIGLNESFNVTCEMLDAHIGRTGDHRTAIIEARADGLRACSYAELFATINRICHVLTTCLGVRPGHRVLLRAPNNATLAACWLAIVRVGAVAVTTTPLLRAKELSEIARKAQPQVALCDARFREELEKCMRDRRLEDPEVPTRLVYFGAENPDCLENLMSGMPEEYPPFKAGPDHPALIAFTSGTTGMPKGTVHFHRDLKAICDAFPKSILEMSPGDRCCGTPPLGFTFGLGGLLCFPLSHGGSTVLAERLSPDALLRLMDATRANILFTAPTMYRQMLPYLSEHRPSSLRYCVSAGEALSQETRTRWFDSTGIQIVDALGSTEMLHVVIASKPADHREGTVGRALPGYQVAVLDDDLRPAATGTLGRLAVRGPTGCRYFADARQANYVRDGWNLTGDVGTLDPDGYFSYFSRLDDMIVSAGYNISAHEIESVLLQHPAVSECAVVGVCDDQRGQIVKAFVVTRAGTSAGGLLARELQDFVKGAIAPYKYPRSVEFCTSLPSTETGKLQRFVLRREEHAEAVRS